MYSFTYKSYTVKIDIEIVGHTLRWYFSIDSVYIIDCTNPYTAARLAKKTIDTLPVKYQVFGLTKQV